MTYPKALKLHEPDHLQEYAMRGYALVPLSRSRRPIAEGWQDAAYRDVDGIVAALVDARSSVVGIITGEPSGIFVLDVDGDAEGEDSLFYWLEEFGPLPETPVVKTPHGSHYYFRWDERIGNRTGVAPGIDVKSNGGYVVAPPSRLPDGSTYFWDIDLTTPVAKAPDWLIEQLKRPEFKREGRKFDLPDVIHKGQRNDILFRAGCSERGKGASDYHVAASIATINDTYCEIPLPPNEIAAIVKSVCRYGIGTKNQPTGETIVVGSEDPFPHLLVEYPLTQIGIAQRMASLYGADIRWCHPWNSWMVWNGTRWERDETGGSHVKRQYRNMLRNLHRVAGDEKIQKWLAAQETNGACTGAIQFLAACEGIGITPGEFDTDDWLLNCPNGVVDIRSGKIRPHKRGDYCMRQTAAHYVDSECPKFTKVIEMAMQGDPDPVDWVWRWLGYGVTGATSEEAFAFWWGASGQNGKSTLLETVGRVLGSYAAVLNSGALMEQSYSSQNNDEIARLTGVRFVTAQETNENARLNDALIKHISGGETISCCMKYGHPFDLKPKFKLTISGNNKPRVGNFDAAFSRRLRLLSFNYRVPDEERDDTLKEIGLPMEYSGILFHLVQSARKWLDVGLGQTNQMVEDTQVYRLEQDSVRAWASQYVRRLDGILMGTEAYVAYSGWADSQGMRPVAVQKFHSRFASMYAQQNTCGSVCYPGIGMVMVSDA